MSGPAWRVAAASVAGTAHVRGGAGCQDVHLWSELCGGATAEGSALIAVLADGAGSASQAAAGARLACSFIHDAIAAWLRGGGNPRDVDRTRALGWLAALSAETTAFAASAGLTARDYSSTLLAAVVGADCASFFQVGDGAIVIAAAPPQEGYECVFWPGHDEYENVTYFAAAPDAAEHLQCALIERRVAELAMFSDGLQRLALDFAAHQPHAPFFRSILSPLHAAVPGGGGPPDALSDPLAAFLDSPRVNARTDDDKTLMLAVRAADEPRDVRCP
jgi:hypothetical protein